MQMVKRIVFLALVCLLALSFTSHGICGLVLTDADGSQTLLSQGKIKSVSEDPMEQDMIFDLENGTLIMLDHKEKVAASGTVDDFCAATKEMAGMMSQNMQRMKEQLEQQGMSDTPVPASSSQASLNKVRIERIGSGVSIAGYATEKYEIHDDSGLYEEIWISKDPSLLKEIGDTQPLAKFEACASRMMGNDSVEASSEYQELMQSGWLFKSIEHGGGYSEVMVEVSQVREKSIPDSEFKIPSGYERVNLDRLFGM